MRIKPRIDVIMVVTDEAVISGARDPHLNPFPGMMDEKNNRG